MLLYVAIHIKLNIVIAANMPLTLISTRQRMKSADLLPTKNPSKASTRSRPLSEGHSLLALSRAELIPQIRKTDLKSAG